MNWLQKTAQSISTNLGDYPDKLRLFLYELSEIPKPEVVQPVVVSWFKQMSQQSEGVPPILSGLVNEALKYPTPEEFQKAFLGEIKHGMYWHLTDNSDFFINPELGPTDMSSMGNSRFDKGKLMITTDLEHWALQYAPHRPYAALIDMSSVPPNEYTQVNRGFGNEFFVNDPSSAKVIGVFDIKDALRIDYEHREFLPQNFEELKAFWQKAHETDMVSLPSYREFYSFHHHLPEQLWEQQWQEDWASTWEPQQ